MLDEDLQGVQDTVDAWHQKRQRMPDRASEMRPDQGPEMSLGRLSTAPHR
ncbi:MAG: hypothetical protein ACK2VA_13100 [Anaerolineae bacterium]|jgi:hypothetical protein